ncbi:MAG: HAMP domain-containing methyl-accepting chemotaxis protein [Candidatus Cloacimonadales bacterium]|jgi:methyl-accepting chemotaxis protein|nr:methyl-accepting chemotaxis protein [Candidatus Cloacimonadota bacterium]MDD2650287.1 HAMP domain-containing methyl-accepting chemotaxis protein [Candidatus Cloacimonadota bacterium]MDX9977016.1 HAMP domain-containing methyl-accepting chemotaxis protein [Candidatus Cloacimonadales bacterium]
MKGLSVSVKIIIGIAFVVILVLGISSSINIFSVKTEQYEILHNRISTTTERLSVQTVSYVWDFNDLDAERTLNYEFSDNSIVAIDIIASDGSNFLTIRRDDSWNSIRKQLDDDFYKHNYSSESATLIHNNNEIATITVYYTDTFAKQEIKKQILNSLLEIIILLFIIIIALIYIVRILISKPLHELLAKFEDISKGEADLSCHIIVNSHDEMGKLACSFNRFVEKLHAIIQKVAITNKIVLDEVLSLSEISNNLVENADSIKIQSESVSSSVSEISAYGFSISNSTNLTSNAVKSSTEVSDNIALDINEVATGIQAITNNLTENNNFIQSVFGNIEQINTNIDGVVSDVNNSASAIEEMSASLSEISINMQRANNISKDADGQSIKTMEIMQELQSSAQEIGKIVDVINTIADQTNMLALNATIEAASAGEAGKGFAVVANEVKALAKQTGDATDRIAQQILGVQQNTSNAVDSMDQISHTIRQLYEISSNITQSVEQQNIATNEISSSVARAADNSKAVSEFAGNIRTSIQQLSESSEEILSTTIIISTKTNQAANATNDFTKTTQEINKMVNDVDNITVEINNGLNEISSNVNNLNTLSDNNSFIATTMNENSEKLKSSIQEIDEIIGSFKL